MKTIIAIILNLGLCVSAIAQVTGSLHTLADETALAYSTNFDYDANDINVRRLSAQVTYTSATIAAATFTDGSQSSGTITILSTTSLNGTVIGINGSYFSFGRVADYPTATLVAVGADTTASAYNLSAKIDAHATIGAIIDSTNTLNVIALLSEAADGVEYPLTTSKPTVVAVSSAVMADGVAATVFVDDTITIKDTDFTLGLPVLLTGSDLPSGLTADTTYYVYKVDDDTIKLSSSSAEALAGTTVNITAVDLDQTAATYTLTPLPIDGAPGFAWQKSNDGIGWADIDTSSVTMSYAAGGTHAFWDFDNYNFRWLRLNVTGPDAGGVMLKAVLNKKD